MPTHAAIHHINGIKTDNRLENLVRCESNGEHHSLYHRGIKKPNSGGRGLPKSPEHRAKIAAALRDKAKSQEHRAKLSASLTGRVLTDAQRAAITAGVRTPEYRALRSKISAELFASRWRCPETGRLLPK